MFLGARGFAELLVQCFEPRRTVPILAANHRGIAKWHRFSTAVRGPISLRSRQGCQEHGGQEVAQEAAASIRTLSRWDLTVPPKRELDDVEQKVGAAIDVEGCHSAMCILRARACGCTASLSSFTDLERFKARPPFPVPVRQLIKPMRKGGEPGAFD